MKIFLTALLSINLSVAAQFLLKAGMSSEGVKSALEGPLSFSSVIAIFTNRFVFGGFALYGIGAVIWLAVLSRWDVSKAYPLVGLGFAVAAVIGWFLGEQMTASRAAGVVLICCGVFLIGRN